MAQTPLSSLFRSIFFVILVAAMAVGAQVDVPMHPVPMTLQSLFILLAGLWLGPVLGVLSVLAYLGLALLGLPVLSGGGAGPNPFSGPTAGYIYAFPLAAGLAGLWSRSDQARSPLASLVTLFGLHLVLLGTGTAWLAASLGFMPAMAAGFTPFLIGALVKSALAYGLWAGHGHYRARRLKRAGTG